MNIVIPIGSHAEAAELFKSLMMGVIFCDPVLQHRQGTLGLELDYLSEVLATSALRRDRKGVPCQWIVRDPQEVSIAFNRVRAQRGPGNQLEVVANQALLVNSFLCRYTENSPNARCTIPSDGGDIFTFVEVAAISYAGAARAARRSGRPKHESDALYMMGLFADYWSQVLVKMSAKLPMSVH